MSVAINAARRPVNPGCASALRGLISRHAVDRVARALKVSRHAVLAAAAERDLRVDVAERIEAANLGTTLEETVARIRSALATARAAARDLPSARVDGQPWGEQRQVLDDALNMAEEAVRS